MNNNFISLLKYVRAETKKQFSHQEIAHLLEIDEISLKELLNKVNNVSLIPGLGSSYNKDDIVKWVELLIERHPEIVASFLVNKSKSGTSPVYKYLHSNHIIFNLGAQKAEKAIEEIISISERTNLIKNQDELLKLVLDRENFCSTAVGGGIAFPHPTLTTFEVVKTTLIVVGISKNGIDFNFFDGRLVNIVVLMAVPNIRMHLQILSRLANIFLSDKVKNDILNSSCEKDVIEIIRGKETELFETH